LTSTEEDALVFAANMKARRLEQMSGPAGLDGLTKMEAAAINIYTQQSPIFRELNRALRDADRSALKPWFCFLRILLTALHKLPSCPGVYFRGVSADIASQYSKGKEVVWWEFASSTGNVEALTQFLKSGVLFSLNVCHAVNISRFSAFPKEDERLILAGTPLRVTGVLPLPGGKATMIQMEEDLSCPPLITGFTLKVSFAVVCAPIL
jgi:hypothetical protein